MSLLDTQVKPVTGRDIHDYLEGVLQAARDSFWEFRLWMDPKLIESWWQHDVAMALQTFYDDMCAGKRPTIVLSSPPQHGKSVQVRDFVAWVAGKNPALKTIFASYSDDLGVRTNVELQRIFDNPRYQMVFPNTRIPSSNVVTLAGRHLRNSSVIEYMGAGGSFRNTTVGGQITGQGLDLGVIDDPIKGRAEASSKLLRDKVWAWLTDDFYSRFSNNGGMIIIATRWHVDDPIGRWMLHYPDARVLKYAAIAESDEKYRRKGEALFSTHKSLEFLLERKSLMTRSSWEALYQQNPFLAGGGALPVDNLRILSVFDRSKISASCRYVDKAGTLDGGAYTAMALMHRCSDGRFVIENITRGQWAAMEREQRLKQLVELDAKLCRNYCVGVEQEPGSGGKESVETTIRNLAGYSVYADKVTGSKEVRAEPFAAQVQAGNVWLVAGTWIPDFLDEAETWPASKYLDQVDACSGAFNRLTLGSTYNLDAMQ
jgi:predicted phage terminase large subunit-like protein